MISPWRTGAALGVAIGSYHLLWSALVAAGVAQAVIDFILKIHFIDVAVRVAPFNAGLAVTLVAVTTAVGFAAGVIFAWCWNWLHAERASAARQVPKAS